jgi:hypothetical protein
MGLLDDAIKDHLELKRRHGADPSEVARLEHEALGPARREPGAAVAAVPDQPAVVDQDDFDDEPLVEDDVLVEEDEEDDAPLLEDEDDGYGDEVIADERLDAPLHRARAVAPQPEAPPPADSTVDQPTQQFSLGELEEADAAPSGLKEAQDAPSEVEDAPSRVEDAADAPSRVEDAPGEPAPRAAPEPEPAADERGPHADVVPADDEPDPDDVLEETPEFLQETPEHDRLWFEQKPPRDFDF